MNSMTGFGAARHTDQSLQVVVEVRAVNARFLKVNIKAPSELSSREQQLEALTKARVRRGSVNMTVHLSRSDAEHLAQVNEELVKAYQTTFERLGLSQEAIPLLRGVIGMGDPRTLDDAEWEIVSRTATEALEQLQRMRKREGAALVIIIGEICDRIAAGRDELNERAPQVVEEHHQKLKARLAQLLDEEVDPQLVAREVAVVADRCDITEELDRLGAHISHLRERLEAKEEVGRTLEFLAQEMLREVNTAGSKSADSDISRLVVELKSAVDQLKEQAANVE